MTNATVEINGTEYVIIPRIDYERLQTLAEGHSLPALPEAGSDGNYPALEYCRATIARDIIKDRVAAGLNQHDLAKLAGISVVTLSRIETGKYTPAVDTVEKIDAVLQKALAKTRRKSPVKPKTGK